MRAAQETILRLHNKICAINNIIKVNESIFGGGVGECTFLENAYLYWIYAANNLGSMCQLNIYVGIGYIMPTIGG